MVETMEDVVREVTILRRILPLRPTVDEYEAALVAMARADADLAERLGQELVRHNKRPAEVPQPGYRALLEMRELVLRMQVQEHKRPWNCIIQAEDYHRRFDHLLQKLASNGVTLVNGGTTDGLESGELSNDGDANGYYAPALPRLPEAPDAGSNIYDSLDLAGGAPKRPAARSVPIPTTARSVPLPTPTMTMTTSSFTETAETKTLSTIAEDGQLQVQCPPKLLAMIQAAADNQSERLEMKDVFSGINVYVPETLGHLKKLTVLKMSGNGIVKLPDSLGDLAELTVLDLQSNSLTLLPETLGRLIKLQKLNVEKNAIEELPWTIGNCESLEVLKADFNQLKALPEAVGYLSKLRILSVHLNNLKGLPTTMGYLVELTELDVHFNQIESLPESLCFLGKLKKLNCSSNFHAFRHLPYKLGHLSELTELDISYNSILELPDSFVMLKNLQKLRLEGNPWRVPPLNVTQQGKQAIFDYMLDMITKKEAELTKLQKRGFFTKAVRACFGFVRSCCDQPQPYGDLGLDIRA